MGNSHPVCDESQEAPEEPANLLGGRYQVTEQQIGKGSFAIVKLGYDIKGKKKVAIRTMNTANVCPATLEHLRREAAIHPELDHPNVVSVLWCRDDHDENQTITMVQEYVPDGSLLDYYAKKRVLAEFEVRAIMIQLVGAVDYMHNKGVVHRDIKADNILIYASTQTIKLADMGFADRFTPATIFRNFPGTLAYSPPELLQGKPHRGPPRDVWSIGVLLYILLTGKYPFGSQATVKTKQRVLNEEPDYSKVSPAAVHLIQRMLDKSPETRITLAEVVVHPWMTGGALMKNPILRRASSTLQDFISTEKKDLPHVGGQSEVSAKDSPPQSATGGKSDTDIQTVDAESTTEDKDRAKAGDVERIDKDKSKSEKKEKERVVTDVVQDPRPKLNGSRTESKPQPVAIPAIIISTQA